MLAGRILSRKIGIQVVATQLVKVNCISIQVVAEFKLEYARRAGIEGTLSQGVRAHGLRRARYIGLAKTHLQHLMIATAINFKRIYNWLSGVPQAITRTSQFVKLMKPETG